MTKKILILSGSPRKQGNSDLLCDEFMRGALEVGHTVEKIRVQEKKVSSTELAYTTQEKSKIQSVCRKHMRWGRMYSLKEVQISVSSIIRQQQVAWKKIY